jgi:hypothetical protein
MPRKGVIERERLFSFYGSNLSIYHPDVTDRFLCPICLTLFTRDALINDPPEVSLAHIIPKSLKGRLYTFVCRRCNNWIGSEYDSQLVREKHFHDWVEGAARISGQLSYYDKEAPVECCLKGSAVELRDIPKKSPPNSWEQFLKAAVSDWSNFKFTLTVSTFNASKLKISILCSAFLMMFYQLGYEYALSPNAHKVRQFIQGSGFPENMHKTVLQLSKGSQDIPHILPSVSILVEPQNFRSFIVVLPLRRNEEAARCVLLPGFGEDGENAYTNILNSVKPFGTFRATLIPDYLKNHLIDIKYKWFANWLWQNVV